ncbi:MAG: M2 family metallopeptidase [Acidobacteriia bacterium]|nr:M2 family metallopeptidase [Terriglobia bacterium]
MSRSLEDSMVRRISCALAITLLFSTLTVAQTQSSSSSKPFASAAAMQAAPAEAETFMRDAEARLDDVGVKASRASWVQSTYITDDTEALSASANEEVLATTTELVNEAKRFKGAQLSPVLQRKFMLLRLALTAPAPNNPAERKELAQIGSWLEGTYGKGKYCPKTGPFAGKCLGQSEMEEAFATTKDEAVLKDLWVGWRSFAPEMRQRYARGVELSNKGAQELGFKDTGVLWRSNYDMTPERFSAELNRLWEQLRPLYLSLHAYVRSQLVKKYGPQVVPPNGPIPAHLLGNIWAQDWTNIYDLLDVPGKDSGLDLTPVLQQKKFTYLKMVKTGENFFVSLGFDPLPKTFWERSMFVRPRDRDVVCHASAWDIDNKNDVRLKMCIQIRDEDFRTIHHELGHNFYQMAYQNQPPLFQGSANDGFHEAVGDTIALSITPEYVQEIGLIQQAPPPSEDLALLMHKALEKVAFLPFGLLIDQWRWDVFSGKITPAGYNKAWWELREKYQGVAPPVARSEKDFDPGAKYHVPGNVPYSRYFLADVLQFQFQRGLCRTIGYKGPLHRCSIYNNKVAGERLKMMLEMGASRPWPEALYALTGERQMDATAILDYFAPLKQWLDEQNAKNGVKVGW